MIEPRTHVSWSIALALATAANAGAARPKPAPGPTPIRCDVAREGGCFDLSVDDQDVRRLDTPHTTAVYGGVDYYRHVHRDRLWFVPSPVSADPRFVFRPNASTAGWLQGEVCLDVIVEAANTQTYRARRFALPLGPNACRRVANVFANDGAVVTIDTSDPVERLPPGVYVAFVRAYGSVDEWDMKTVFFTVGEN